MAPACPTQRMSAEFGPMFGLQGIRHLSRGPQEDALCEWYRFHQAADRTSWRAGRDTFLAWCANHHAPDLLLTPRSGHYRHPFFPQFVITPSLTGVLAALRERETYAATSGQLRSSPGSSRVTFCSTRVDHFQVTFYPGLSRRLQGCCHHKAGFETSVFGMAPANIITGQNFSRDPTAQQHDRCTIRPTMSQAPKSG